MIEDWVLTLTVLTVASWAAIYWMYLQIANGN